MFEDLGLASRMGDSVELMNLKINDELHGPSDGPIRKLCRYSFFTEYFFSSVALPGRIRRGCVGLG